MEGKDEMTKASGSLQDLRRGIYVKAKAEPSWRFWGLYVHVCKMDTLQEAYAMAKKNNGAPGIDGVTFEDIEAQGAEALLEQIRDELTEGTYMPMRARKKEIPKDGGKVRVLSIPSIRDRVVQGALKLILEPIFEADFQPGSYGYRPRRTAHEAVNRVAGAIVQQKTCVIDLDLRAYFDTVQHHLLLDKVALRVQDDDVMHLLRLILKASGKQGVPQGGVISPLLSNIYLTEVDRMLERAKAATTHGGYCAVEYVRFADDLVVLVDNHPRHAWLKEAVPKRLRQELAKLQVEVNEEKSTTVELARGESFGFLGFDFRRVRSLARSTAAPVHAQAQEAHGAAGEGAGGLQTLPFPTGGSGDRTDQSDPARLGELLCGGTFQQVLWLHSRLGRKEGPAPHDAIPEPPRLRLDEVE